ncbi:MAG: metallophosphoesterase, partial [Eubacterium sp.]|nr:metallophosphoesterase [Eubacterium sp.]
MKILKKAAAILMCCTMLSAAAMPFTAYAEKQESTEETMELKFNENGEFKILAIADPQETDTPQQEMLDIINNALDKVNPDLVVFLGDNIAGWWKNVDKEKTATAIRKIIEPVDSRGVPFAIVFGNHDHEGLTDENNKMTEEEAKEFQLSIYQEYKTCLAIEGEELTGCGNYNLLIKDSAAAKDIFNLWLIDSNPYAAEGGYGYVQPDQKEWYIRTSNELKEANGGVPLPSLLFQHIAVPEVYQLADSSSSPKSGYVHGNTAMFKDKYWKANS